MRRTLPAAFGLGCCVALAFATSLGSGACSYDDAKYFLDVDSACRPSPRVQTGTAGHQTPRVPPSVLRRFARTLGY
ncbi:hypothetical protein C8Q72DRAFT_574789 [Fomitopsis betulina]|nr:hypothetical protein C8Q72DRAFT_574789 [Fomitopsis betulina]